MIARTTQRPPITPTVTQANMLHRIGPSSAVDTAESAVELLTEKKSASHVVCALSCFVAEMIIHVNETANAARVRRMWRVVYRRNSVAFSCRDTGQGTHRTRE